MRHRRRSRRRRDSREEYDSDRILFPEFRFYNKEHKLINDDKLLKIYDDIVEEKRKRIFWTNEKLGSNGIGFMFYGIKGEKETEKEPEKETDVYAKVLTLQYKFSPQILNKCYGIIKDCIFVGYNMTDREYSIANNGDLYGYNSYSSYDDDEKETTTIKKTMDNWNEVVDYMIKEKLLDKYGNKEDHEWDEYKKDIELLFPSLKLDKPKYEIFKGSSGNTTAYHIIEVIEKRIDNKNYRIAITGEVYYDAQFGINIFSEDDKEYNYIDKDRIYFKTDNDRTFFLDEGLMEMKGNKIFFNLNLFASMKRNIHEILNKEQYIITAPIYRFYKDRVSRFELDEEDILDEKEMLIIEQYKVLLKRGKIIKINNTNITPNKIEVVGENFTMVFTSKFLNVTQHIGKIKQTLNVSGDARYNFNRLYESLLKLSVLDILRMDNTKEDDYKEFTGTTFIVNGLKIKVEKVNSRIKINNVFCRINDVFYILSKVICYTDVEEFNKYVKDVSYIGIEWKKMISNGIALDLYNPFYKIFTKTGDTALERMYMRFSLLWDAEKRSVIYLMLNGIKYRIRYKGKFKRMFNYLRRSLSMSQLMQELNDCIEGINSDMIIEIVENAVKEAKIIKERGEELVRETVSDIKAIKTEVDIGGKKTKGYRFKGRLTDTDYFIDAIDLDVFKYENGSWNRRCVIDDHTKDRIFEDRLANRLVNIFNEPKKIFTLHN